MAESGFKATKSFGLHISFDDAGRRFLLDGKLYDYSRIAGYSYIEETGKPKRGFARAYSLSLFGVGVPQVMSMKLRITLRESEELLFIDFLVTPVKPDSSVYKNFRRTADGILAKLEQIQPENADAEGRAFDYTEEIRKLRSLADQGAITEAEYEAKKTQLLGI